MSNSKIYKRYRVVRFSFFKLNDTPFNLFLMIMIVTFFSGYLYNDYPLIKVSILLLFFICFLYDFFYLGVQSRQIIFVFIFAFFPIIFLSLFSYNIESLFFCFSILLGFFLAKRIDLVFRAGMLFILINLFFLLYESLTQSYLLQPTADSFYFSGRAKGLFSYSKEYAGFLVVFTTVFIKKIKPSYFLILIISALLTGSRLPMITIFFLWGCVNLKHLINFNWKALVLAFIVIFIGCSFFIYYSQMGGTEHIIKRTLDSFNTDSSSNSLRIYFWSIYASMFSDFNAFNILFGYPGYITSEVGNGAESAWLAILSDGGIFMLSAYVFCTFYLALFKNEYCSSISILVLIFSMQISRITMGFYDGIFIWTLFFSLFGNSVLSSSEKTGVVNDR